MKRDMDLIRRIILKLESSPTGFAEHPLSIDGYEHTQIGYYAYLLVDSGLALGADATAMESSGPEYLLTHLTWAGHDFADACRDESVWNKAKNTIKSKVTSVTFEVLKALLTSILKTQVGI